MAEPVLKVAVGTPLNQLFDYLPGSSDQPLAPGQRVRVPFGRREQTGVIVELADQAAVPVNKLRATLEILDREPLLDAQLMAFLKWAARYYQHPPGEVFAAAMPAALRQGGAPVTAHTFVC